MRKLWVVLALVGCAGKPAAVVRPTSPTLQPCMRHYFPDGGIESVNCGVNPHWP